MKTFYVKLSDRNLYFPASAGIFILQCENINQAYMVIKSLFMNVSIEDIKEIDSSLFNFEGEQ